MLERTFYQRLCCRMPILLQQLFIKASPIDTDADGDMLILAYLHHRLNPILTADITGIDADF